jgi:hypothetical protein
VEAPEKHDRLVELQRLRFQEISVTKRWETACNRLAHFPSGANERQVAELAAERDQIRASIQRLSTNRAGDPPVPRGPSRPE